jgi:Domain of unknown function (DUF397)
MSRIRTSMRATELRGTTWVKSSRSGPTGGNCVEMAVLPGDGVAVRNSRHPEGLALIFTGAQWHAFIHGVASGVRPQS